MKKSRESTLLFLIYLYSGTILVPHIPRRPRHDGDTNGRRQLKLSTRIAYTGYALGN